MTDFERYVAEYSRELTRFCIKLCGDVHDAEDLFQDTWARALDKFDQYDQSSSFKSWLFTICADQETDVDAYLDLHAAILSLPKKHRLVLVLYYFREFSQSEIARMLDIPEGTVKSRLNTAKKLLKRRLYDEETQ